MQATSAQVIEIRSLTDRLTQLFLAPAQFIPYQAGQYLKLILPDNPHAYSYSIANAPTAARTYELHIRHGADQDGNQHLIDTITLNSELTVQLPFGDCTLRALDPKRPLLFIAGGTGFAPIKAMLEQLQLDHNTQCTTLIWRAKNQQDLYLNNTVIEWQRTRPWFHYIPQYERESLKTTLANHPSHPVLSNWQIVLAGPFDMVYSLRDELITLGVPRARLYSDAFAFEANL